MIRDPAQRVYDIEKRVFGETLKTTSLEKCQEFLDSVVSSPVFKRRFPKRSWSKAKVYKAEPGSEHSCAGHGEMWLAPNHLEKSVVLHELAHAVNSKHRTPFHGKAFRRRLVFLVENFMPRKYGLALKEEFRQAFGD